MGAQGFAYTHRPNDAHAGDYDDSGACSTSEPVMETPNPYLPNGINKAGLLHAIEESNGIEWDAEAVAELKREVEELVRVEA